MRFLCAAALILFASPALACTAGGRPCDEVYNDQLRGIDQTRTNNMRRQEQIEQEAHRNNLARIKREEELRAARGGNSPQPQQRQTVNRPTGTTADTSPECKAFPAMCSAYK